MQRKRRPLFGLLTIGLMASVAPDADAQACLLPFDPGPLMSPPLAPMEIVGNTAVSEDGRFVALTAVPVSGSGRKINSARIFGYDVATESFSQLAYIPIDPGQIDFVWVPSMDDPPPRAALEGGTLVIHHRYNQTGNAFVFYNDGLAPINSTGQGWNYGGDLRDFAASSGTAPGSNFGQYVALARISGRVIAFVTDRRPSSGVGVDAVWVFDLSPPFMIPFVAPYVGMEVSPMATSQTRFGTSVDACSADGGAAGRLAIGETDQASIGAIYFYDVVVPGPGAVTITPGIIAAGGTPPSNPLNPTVGNHVSISGDWVVYTSEGSGGTATTGIFERISAATWQARGSFVGSGAIIDKDSFSVLNESQAMPGFVELRTLDPGAMPVWSPTSLLLQEELGQTISTYFASGFGDVLRFDCLGVNYCSTNPNSTGVPGTMSGVGSDFVSDNLVTLGAGDLPMNSITFFLASLHQGFIMNPGGSDGNLCLSGQIGRLVAPGQVQSSGAAGSVELAIDLTSIPQVTMPVSVMPGDRWNFQAWYRDSGPTGPTTNLTDGYSILFR